MIAVPVVVSDRPPARTDVGGRAAPRYDEFLHQQVELAAHAGDAGRERVQAAVECVDSRVQAAVERVYRRWVRLFFVDGFFAYS